MKKIIEQINQEQMKKKLPNFRIGDTVKVQVKIVEGDKERIQAYSGTVIARTGSGINTTIRVRRISFGEGVERIFLVHSPRIEKIEVTKIGEVRRSKLYYLRDRIGKKGKIAQKRRLLVEGEPAVAVGATADVAVAAQAPAPEALAASAVPQGDKKV